MDGDDVYECNIDLEKLKDEKQSPSNCWTAEHKSVQNGKFVIQKIIDKE